MRLITPKDLIDLTTIGVLFFLAGVVPERHWERLSGHLARWRLRYQGYSCDHLTAVTDRQLGISARDLEFKFRQHNYWELLEILRDYWPGGWNAKTVLIGEEHITAALARGKGVVFWYCNFTRSMIPHFMATQAAGYPVSNLLSRGHPFSDTTFGRNFLNPIRITIESRYLRENCLIGNDSAGPAIRQLIQRLEENKCVHIAAVQSGTHVGVRPFLGGHIRLAKGAPSIALSAGATLLPVFPVPVGPSSFEVHVGPPLTSEADDDKTKQEDMVTGYVSQLERYVREWPHLWRGWVMPSYWSPDDNS